MHLTTTSPDSAPAVPDVVVSSPETSPRPDIAVSGVLTGTSEAVDRAVGPATEFLDGVFVQGCWGSDGSFAFQPSPAEYAEMEKQRAGHGRARRH